jgi:hypothetical protein
MEGSCAAWLATIAVSSVIDVFVDVSIDAFMAQAPQISIKR